MIFVSVCLYPCVSVCLYPCVSVCLYPCVSVCLYPCVSVCLYPCVSVCLYPCVSLCLYPCVSVCLYPCVFVCSYLFVSVCYCLYEGVCLHSCMFIYSYFFLRLSVCVRLCVFTLACFCGCVFLQNGYNLPVIFCCYWRYWYEEWRLAGAVLIWRRGECSHVYKCSEASLPSLHKNLYKKIQYKHEYYSGINPVEFRGHTNPLPSSSLSIFLHSSHILNFSSLIFL